LELVCNRNFTPKELIKSSQLKTGKIITNKPLKPISMKTIFSLLGAAIISVGGLKAQGGYKFWFSD
jgi:hypothetical protein